MTDEIVLLEDNAVEVLALWGLRPGDWQLVGFVKSELERQSRPIVEIGGEHYLLRRQPPDLTEDDTRFRHTLMRHLAAQGLPVPALLPRPEGYTYAMVVDGIYEMQGWRDGRRYVSGDPDDADMQEAAAATLGALHQASADFQWQPHRWPEERSAAALAQAYIALIRERAESATLPEGLAHGLARVAEGCAARLDAAMEALETPPGPPELHLHGDYQPHNLGFGLGAGSGVAAIYDFDAARFGRRIDELAYALLYFTGARWDEQPSVTPPLVDDGLDVLAAHRWLAAYGREAPPAEGEARLLADALTLAFPAVFANGIAEDLVFPDDFAGEIDEEEALARLNWADTFWLWLDRYRDTLAQAWENG
jgi:Ser/Thr protein kinase RdoA (MazF antagonist)